ncbi:mandelate racemase/muconate lactonizing enzyme family protein [Pigmentiphaga soli]|uniref:Mandelate racemase/muconate lactonizing enzyme family protein n=1 Tax=Pigmentiphaga soli TaxID=1007095 RepID=A0ABP8HIG1_9BURK
MKINKIYAEVVGVPETHNLAGLAVEPPTVRNFIVVHVITDDGVEGLGLTFHFYANPLTKALHSAIEELGALLAGFDPLQVEAVHARLHAAAWGAGPGGIFALALSAIDIALWDIRGKVEGQPLWKLLGGLRGRAPTYASGTVRRELSDADAVRCVQALAEQGFPAVKIQTALAAPTSPEREVARVRLLRRELDPAVAMMVDSNQGWRPEQAIDICRRLEDVGMAWVEDAIAHDDFAGLARLAAALSTPVAGGEYLWGIAPFAQMIAAHSVDILIVDLFRVGGVTQWLKVAGMAQAFNLPVASHVVPEIAGHLVAARPNGLTIEYVTWSLPLFEETPRLENGELVLSDRPGLGLTLDRAFIDRHKLS